MWYNISEQLSRDWVHSTTTEGDEGHSMNAQYLTKTEAIIEVMQKTGYGRFVIEKRIEKLVGAGTIRLIDDPGDRRKQLISRQDVQAIIDSLTI
jgi:hypothetical protein